MFGNFDSKNTPKRIERKSKDRQFILDVINKTSKYTGKKLLSSEIEGLVRYIQDVDYRLLIGKPRGEMVDILAKNFISQMRVTSGNIVDTHELMKQQIGTIQTYGDESLYTTLQHPPYNVTHGTKEDIKEGLSGYGEKVRNDDVTPVISNGQASHIPTALENSASMFSSATDKYPRIAKQPVQNIYLLLDSKYRNLSTDPSVFQWTVSQSANTTQGSVNTLSDQIHNIINVQFDRFNIPYVGSADNVYKKISVFIQEFASTSVLIHSGRYHMMFDSEISGNRIQLTPLINDEGRFRFHTPINVLDTITLTFKSPFSSVEFLPDRYNVKISSLNATQSTLEFSENHGVADGELVHLEGFTTLSPTADNVQIQTINREQGHVVTFINNLQLRIDVGLSTANLDVNNIVDCFIATRRLIIPVRMEYLV